MSSQKDIENKSLSKSTSHVPSLFSGSVDFFYHGRDDKSDDGAAKREETSGSEGSDFGKITEVNSEDEEVK